MLTKSVKYLSTFAVAGMLSIGAIGANAQSPDGQGYVFLPFVASESQESHGTFTDGNTPHTNVSENSSEPTVQAAQALAQAGEVTSTSFELGTDISLKKLELADWSLSAERKYTNRLLLRILNRYDYMPEAMGFSVSNSNSETPSMFVAATLGKADIKHTHQAGLLIQSKLNPATNQFDIIAERVFPECEELAGVQSSQDGMTIAVLCKTKNENNSTRTDFTRDLVKNFGPDNDMPEAKLPDNGHYDLWLYEWTNGDIATDPNKFIVHTSLNEKHGLPHSFVYGEEDNTYAISATQQAKGGHTNDSFYIVQRAETPENYKIVKMHRGMANNDLRGWQNSCSVGHPFLVSVSFNPVTKEYSVICTSEANNKEAGSDIAGINLARGKIIKGEKHEKGNFLLLQRDGASRMKGGGGALLPLGNGWISVVIGADVERAALDGKSASPATQVGLVQFDQSGNVIAQSDSNPKVATVGEGIHWVKTPDAYENHYVSYPQLVPLDAANGKYLLGYGIMPASVPASGVSDTSFGSLHWKLTFPMKYFVQEIKIECKEGDSACTNSATITLLTEAKELSGVGWGMIDQMVPLGVGQVGWATYEMNRMTIPQEANSRTQPNAFTKKLQFNVYSSSTSSISEPPSTTNIRIHAHGDEGDEKMELRIDGESVSQWTVSVQPDSYDYAHPTQVNADQISIHFINAGRDKSTGYDLNLVVDKMVLNGTTHETEGPSVIGKGHWDGSSCRTVAAHRTQKLHCNGYFQY